MTPSPRPADLLADFFALGVRLRVVAGRLLFDAPAGVLTADRLALLRRHKPELVDLLGWLQDAGREPQP